MSFANGSTASAAGMAGPVVVSLASSLLLGISLLLTTGSLLLPTPRLTTSG